jgi:thiamine phosphate synthase YjbQ (UPF0047 family)
VQDLTPILRRLLAASGMQQGLLTVVSRHTTTSIVINERESRLAQDMSHYFLQLAPPDERSFAAASNNNTSRSTGIRYLHNDIDKRPDSDEEAQRCVANGWNITDANSLQEWRAQEPINAHSHLLSMMLGSSECIPVANASMVLGQWQSYV